MGKGFVVLDVVIGVEFMVLVHSVEKAAFFEGA